MSIKKLIILFCIFSPFVKLTLNCEIGFSQIVPDTTLGSEGTSIVTPANINGLPSEKIEGGETQGANLFHSFQQFDVGEGRGAYFNNPTGIENILTRVTGNIPSNVLGTLGVLGDANLFLINPNGIIFGPDARLDMRGAFLASTANSINLSDGIQFSATNPQPVPLLTINVPIGLGFNTGNPGPIKVEGYGHNLFTLASVGAPVFGSGLSSMGLKTQPGKTIALVGGQVNFDGGILTTPSGRIEVGSVATGLVDMNLTPDGLFLSYGKVENYQDIQLDKVSLLDASGFFNGNIFLQGRSVTLTDASLAIISNFGEFPLGKIAINTTENLQITGIKEFTRSINNNVTLSRGIITQNFSTGKGADIVVSSKQLSIQDFASISTQNSGLGSGGNIDLVVGDSTQVFSNLDLRGLTIGSVISTTSGTGQGGNLSLSTKTLSIEDGGVFAAETFGSGNGGNVVINASKNIKISGGTLIDFDSNFENNSFWSSFLGALTTSFGNAGNVLINTDRLILENGGRLDSSTIAAGSAGSLTINAFDSVDISGRAPGFLNPTLINSSATVIDPFFNYLFSLPNTLTGASGDVTINTSQLNIRDGAQISVRNDGNKNAGNLQINANFINLDNQGSITATTASGQGGNIFLQAQNLIMHDNSIISATAGGTGNGGNITIDTGVLAALENSDISANAQGARGGQVIIDAQGIFGTQFRNTLTAESDITATGGSPQLSGTVEINTPDVDPVIGLANLPEELVDASNQIAQGCPAGVGPTASKFVITGRGGIPNNPNEPLSKDTIWTDLRPTFDSAESRPSSSPVSTQLNNPTEIVEANGWMVNSKGEVILTASPRPTLDIPWIHPSGCHAS